MIWLVLVSVIWGLSFGLIGSVLAGLPSAYVACVRLILCLLVFLPFIRKVPFKMALGLMAIGGIQFGLMYVTYIKAFSYMKSYEVAIFTILTPIYVTLLYDLMVRRLSARHLSAAVIAVAGAGVILWQGWSSGMMAWKGFLILQLSNLCFAVGQLAYARWKKPFEHYREYSVFGWLYLGAVLVALPFVGTGQWQAGWEGTTENQWYALLYLGIVASGLSFFMWNHGARLVSPARLAVMNNLKIPLAALFSICLFGERAEWGTLLVGMVLLGVSIVISGERRRSST